jgi:hypothetical protein
MIKDLEIETGGDYERYFVSMVLQCCSFNGFNSEIAAQEIKKNNRDFFSMLYQMTFGITYNDEINNNEPYKCYINAFNKYKVETLLDNNFLLMRKINISINDINEMLYSDYSFYINKLILY